MGLLGHPAVFVAGYLVTLWAMSVNAFFAQTVRLQKERGHTVVLGACFLLGSLWALVPWLLYLAVTVVRTALEDRTLHGELDGYSDDARRTRYRLVSLIW